MKITFNLLKKYLSFDENKYNIFLISEILTNIGLEIENSSSIPKKENFLNIFVGKILKIQPHENANSLQICKIDIGNKILQIVCGAKNIYENMIVPVAIENAIIPNGKFKIKKSKIRGIESEGMLCSPNELMLDVDNQDGIFDLTKNNFKIGDSFYNSYNPQNYFPIELNITPNRGYALSLQGIANDLHAYSQEFQLISHNFNSLNPHFNSKIYIQNEDKNTSIHFCEIKNIKLKSKLTNEIYCLLSINNIKSKSLFVDLLNYFMLSFGQPLNSYDLDTININETIIIKKSNNVQFSAIDGNIYQLHDKDLIVENNRNIISLAGIINGNKNLKNEKDLSNILIESASFPKESLSKTNQRLKINSQHCYRFERGIAHLNCKQILENFLSFAENFFEFEKSNIISKEVSEDKMNIILDIKKINNLYGNIIPTNEIKNYLIRMNYKILKEFDEKIHILSSNLYPFFDNENKIYEEIIRLYGFKKLNSKNLFSTEFLKNYDPIYELKQKLSIFNFTEIITLPFVDFQINKLFAYEKEVVFLQNPFSNNKNTMRASLFPNILFALSKNISNIKNYYNIYEYGKIFKQINNEIQEENCLSFIKYYNKKLTFLDQDIDILNLKKDIVFVLKELNIEKYSIEKNENILPYVQTNFSYKILNNKKELIGYFGLINKMILNIFDIKKDIYFFEFFISKVNLQPKKIKNLFFEQKIQPIVREFAFILDKSIKINSLISNVLKSDILIKNCFIKDIFLLKNDTNKQSIAIEIHILPRNDKSLNNQEINVISDKVVQNCEKNLNAILRNGINAN